MARISILANRSELRVRMIRPDVSGFLPSLVHGFVELILTIGDSVPWSTLHPGLLSQTTNRILQEVEKLRKPSF